MAKRKKAKKATGTKRRKVGAVDKQGLMSLALVTGGAIAAQLVSNAADKIFKNKPLSPQIKGLALIGIGQFLTPMLLKGATGKQLGLGMSVAGGLKLASTFGIKGLGATPFMALPQNGISQQVAGPGIQAMVAGTNTRKYAVLHG